MAEMDLPNDLTEYEKEQLMVVMKKAKEFQIEEEKHLLRQRLEGQLLKFTNVVKGYQYRWFVVNPDSGTLDYYEKEDNKRSNRPRGSLILTYAVVCPSDEDSQTFVVNASNGEIYKLKAADAKDRQHWVNRLRAVAEYHTERVNAGGSMPPSESRTSLTPRSSERPRRPKPPPTSQTHTYIAPPAAPDTISMGSGNTHGMHTTKSFQSLSGSSNGLFVGDPFKGVSDLLHELNTEAHSLSNDIDLLPQSGPNITAFDKNILVMKATGRATIVCLEKCLNVLRTRRSIAGFGVATHAGDWNGGLGSTGGSGGRSLTEPDQKSSSGSNASGMSGSAMGSQSGLPLPVPDMDTQPISVQHEDDVEDTEQYDEEELGSVEEHKSVILHMISQLKLGMDLTKVVLPTFILEKRSLLEMFADCMAHPDMFLRITDLPDQEGRMLGVVEWYLASFHAGRKGSIAKKPYNPIIGETFHCSWKIPATPAGDTTTRLNYTAEQVSHHPPITAFYFESPEKRVYMQASIHTKSKFQGMSICAAMIGKLSLQLLAHDEEYIFTLPSVYARSILTVPWVELGDKITISCPKTKYSASIVFHTKPFYGGKLHRISAEVKNPSGTMVYKAQGEWNGVLEFENAIKNERRVVDVGQLPSLRKCVPPLGLQRPQDSRRLWRHVTDDLRAGKIDKATEHKRELEERQRASEKYRRDHNVAFPVKYFTKTGDHWSYRSPLCK